MNPVFIIAKKRDGEELSAGEIHDLVCGYVSGEVADYQMAAWAMAVYWRGMTTEETAALTESMLASGAVFSWPNKDAFRVDKHSTGGLGDKTSLILTPMLACCGLQVPMLSGRGLGATGGTLDKLESIVGYRSDLSTAEIQKLTQKIGCVISGTSSNLVPADRKLYALRDVTATVPSIPLITASIMSKKLAEGLDALVLDVKYGSGAFMKTAAQASRLAESLVATGKRMGVKTTALLTDMNQPLGQMVGNSVEVNESVMALQGSGPTDLLEVVLALGVELLLATGISADQKSALALLNQTLSSGAAYEKFAEMVQAQGGDLRTTRPIAPTTDLTAQQTGTITSIETEQLGRTIISLGGGRKRLGETLDFSIGLKMLVRIGDQVTKGDALIRVFAEKNKAHQVTSDLLQAIRITDNVVAPPKLIVQRFT